MVRSPGAPPMTPGRAVLVGLVERYLGGLMDPFESLLEIHKLMYFMQEAGEPLRLRYMKAPYGPYAENLRQVLAHVEGHFLTGYADGGDAPDKQLELVPGASKDALAFLDAHPDTKATFDRVAELVQGFETPFGMELLATVGAPPLGVGYALQCLRATSFQLGRRSSIEAPLANEARAEPEQGPRAAAQPAEQRIRSSRSSLDAVTSTTATAAKRS
jgi:hypothetical protein